MKPFAAMVHLAHLLISSVDTRRENTAVLFLCLTRTFLSTSVILPDIGLNGDYSLQDHVTENFRFAEIKQSMGCFYSAQK